MTAIDTAATGRDTLTDNVRLVRRFVQEVFVEGRKDAVDELASDDFVSHGMPVAGRRQGRPEGSDRPRRFCADGHGVRDPRHDRPG